MKVKIFASRSTSQLENDINGWLSIQKGIKITNTTQSSPSIDETIITIFYEA